MGPIGLNKAEKELIMRRYKAGAHGQSNSLNRISPGYQNPQYVSQDRQYSYNLNLSNQKSNVVRGSNNSYVYKYNYQGMLDRNDLNPRYSNNKAVNIIRSSKNQLHSIHGAGLPQLYN